MNKDRVLRGDRNTAGDGLLILYDAVLMRTAHCGGSERASVWKDGVYVTLF